MIEAKKEGVTLTGVETLSDKYTKGLPAGLPRWSNPLPFAYQTTGAAYLEYNWNGRSIDAVFEVAQLL